MDKKNLLKAAATAFVAQGITAAVSALTILLLAGRLGAADYGLWQLYTLAGSFSGLCHLGLCDGVYLRLGGQKYDTLNFPQLGRQFRRMLACQIAVSAVGILIVLLFTKNLGIFGINVSNGRIWSICTAFIYMPIFNATAYLGFVLQATGRTVIYSWSSVIDRVAFVILSFCTVLAGASDFRIFIFVSITAKLLSLAYCVYMNRRLVFSGSKKTKILTVSTAKSQTAADISAGARLLFANLAGQMIIGGARIAIILCWGDAEFGRVSFVITLSAILLQFTAQLAMVAFPTLRQEDGERLERIFERMRTAAELLLPAVFLVYIPAKLAVEAFLPQYSAHMSYLPLLLPLCLFESKTQLINQTYLKVKRLEGRLLAVNLISAALCAALCFFAAFVIADIGAVLLGAVIGSAVQCYLTDICGRAGERRAALMSILSEGAVSAVFVCASFMLPDFAAAGVYFLFYLGYLAIRVVGARGEKVYNK